MRIENSPERENQSKSDIKSNNFEINEEIQLSQSRNL
jgi:hypothetical protein